MGYNSLTGWRLRSKFPKRFGRPEGFIKSQWSLDSEWYGKMGVRPLKPSRSFGKHCPCGAVDRHVVPVPRARRGCKFIKLRRLH